MAWYFDFLCVYESMYVCIGKVYVIMYVCIWSFTYVCMYVCMCLAVRRARRQLSLGEAERVVRRALQVDAARQTGPLTLVQTNIHTYIHTYIHRSTILPGTKICYLIASDLAFQPVQP